MRTLRPLTPGERALAAAWLPAGLDLDAVRIRRGRFLPGQPADVAMTPFGVPHFPAALHADDFAVASLAQQALFIHELVHAWQYQQGVAVAWRGLWLHWRRRRGKDPYAYRLHAGMPLAAYGIEQQAQIVEDAFRLAHGLPPRYPQPAGVLLADYRALLRDAGNTA